MNMIGSRVRSAVLVGAAVATSVALSACGSFDSKASGEHLIDQWVPNQLAKGVGDKLSVKSVDCPSGVKQKDGGSYNCKVSILDKTTGKVHSGTITIHMSGNQVKILNGQDLHVS
jgi:hypothetical protein